MYLNIIFISEPPRPLEKNLKSIFLLMKLLQQIFGTVMNSTKTKPCLIYYVHY